MTANDCTPGDGHESDGSNDSEKSAASFEKWAREHMSARIRVKATDPAEYARNVAEDVHNGNPVSAEDVSGVRRESRELIRLVDGALVTSQGCSDVDRKELGSRIHEAGLDVQEAALDLDSALLNEEEIEPRDIEMVREHVEELNEILDEVAREV